MASGPAQSLALARRAEEVGCSTAWVAEAYGSDAPSVLAWLAAQTTRIGLGSAVMQVPARSAAATAMTAATLDTLSGGRFRLGLGVSGPQVSEGWHGVRFDAPLARTREYVDVVRLALSRRPVAYDGEHLRLPLPDGPGVPLRLALCPPRERIPVYLAAVGPRNVELAGQVADGWLPVFFSPEHAQEALAALARGRGRRDPAAGSDGFDVAPTVPLVVTADGPAPARADAAEAASGPVRAHAALYLGGMGSREQNFYRRLAERMGYGAEAARVQEHFLAGRHREAAAAVPRAFLQATCLIGPAPALRDRLQALAGVGVTTVCAAPMAPALEQRLADLGVLADALDAAGTGA
ncbi:LLM class F420-dependent oxidoreductase [Quadrisphaera sp. DSM 44207]|uniref:LLM class F420-dependent oxidoreductase n=1 Tax=Quadrisphaera sp. DSM 44207 TaxID=1881057 RepID=UPI001C40B0E9